MDVFQNISVIWFLIGLAFFLLEFIVPGFILFFFGIGAWIVGGVTLFTDPSLTVQLVIFAVSSLLSVFLFRKWVQQKLGMDKASGQVLEDEIIGQTAVCSESISPGLNGKIEFRGTQWDASSDQFIAAGETVIITANKSILLIVRPIKPL